MSAVNEKGTMMERKAKTYRVLPPGKQMGALNTWSVMAGGMRLASCQREDCAQRIVDALNAQDDRAYLENVIHELTGLTIEELEKGNR